MLVYFLGSESSSAMFSGGAHLISIRFYREMADIFGKGMNGSMQTSKMA